MARVIFTSAPFPRKSKVIGHSWDDKPHLGGIVPYTAAGLQVIRRLSYPTQNHNPAQQISVAAIAQASHIWRNIMTQSQLDEWNALADGHRGGEPWWVIVLSE